MSDDMFNTTGSSDKHTKPIHFYSDASKYPLMSFSKLCSKKNPRKLIVGVLGNR